MYKRVREGAKLGEGVDWNQGNGSLKVDALASLSKGLGPLLLISIHKDPPGRTRLQSSIANYAN